MVPSVPWVFHMPEFAPDWGEGIPNSKLVVVPVQARYSLQRKWWGAEAYSTLLLSVNIGLFLPPYRADNPAGHGSKEVKGKTHTYYQVLIDARDCPHIVSKLVGWARGSSQGRLGPKGSRGVQ